MMNDNLTRKGLRRADPSRPRPLSDAVLHLIWSEQRISRAEIARLAGLSRSTVSEIINEILPTGLVREIGEGPSRGGRRPIVLEFQDDACVILGIEMGGAHVAVAATDLRGRVLAWGSREHHVRKDPQGTRAIIGDLCRINLGHPSVAGRPLVGIGVAVPSPVNPSATDQLSTVVMPSWEGRLGLDDLAAELGAPILVDNDANLGALAERWWGAGQEVDHLAYIKVATGIGSGHVINGDIYRGATGVAGEIGHLAIDPQGEPCICGLKGCLVTFVGAHALEQRALELAPDHHDTTLDTGAITIRKIEDAALAGDPLALKVIGEAAEHLGTAIAGLLNVMNPSMVVLGGDLSRLGELILAPLRRTIRNRTLVTSVAAAEILVSELGHKSVAVGAATMVLKAALEDSHLFPVIAASGDAAS